MLGIDLGQSESSLGRRPGDADRCAADGIGVGSPPVLPLVFLLVEDGIADAAFDGLSCPLRGQSAMVLEATIAHLMLFGSLRWTTSHVLDGPLGVELRHLPFVWQDPSRSNLIVGHALGADVTDDERRCGKHYGVALGHGGCYMYASEAKEWVPEKQ